MPRLCLLTQYFPPELGAPQARLSELGERLVDAGWEVEVITALPNYPAGEIAPGYAPLRPVVEEVGRLRTVRVPLYPSSRGFSRRMLTYLSFAGSAAALGPALAQRPDLLYVESPPLFLGLGAWSLALSWRRPYVLNVSDLWPESAIRMGVVRPGAATWAAERLELALYRHAAGVTGQSQGIIDSVRERSPGVRAELITNGVDPARFGPAQADAEARALLGDGPGPLFIYAGLFGHAQGLDQIFEVAGALPPELPARFALVGDGPLRPELEARAKGNPRVRVLPAQPRARIPALLAAADVALITLGVSLPGAVPSKIYEAMAAGLPILLVAGGEPAQRVEAAQAGLCVPPGDRAALVAAATRLASDAALREALGAGGRRAAESSYDRGQIAGRLDRFLRSCLKGEGAGA